VTTGEKDISEKEAGWTVRTTSDWLKGLTSPRDGWMLPSKLKAEAKRGDLHVNVEIDVVEGRARARRVEVETDNPRGVGWTALAKIPVRNIVATAVLDSLWKTVPDEEGVPNIVPMGSGDADAAREVVQAAVGYHPKPIREARDAS
jgi:hypothetical protein